MRLLLVASFVLFDLAHVHAQPRDVRTERALDRAEALLEAGRRVRARAALRRSHRRAPTARGATLAVRLLPRGDAAIRPDADARRDATWVLHALDDFTGPEVERARAWALAMLERHSEAVSAIAIRTQDEPSSTQLTQLSALFVARDDLRNAERAARRALRIMPQSRDLQVDLASILVARGKPEPAAQILLGVLQLNPNDHDARRDLAGTLMAAGRPDEAFTTLRQLVRVAEDPLDSLLLSDAAMQLGRHRVAEESARQAIARGAATGYATLALALAAQGRRTEAEQALARAPDDVRARRARRVLGENAQ